MSTLYVTEPPTDGKVILHTSKGEIEIELWSKEAPKACRNLVALALEGYYDGCLWHRIVPQFCIQTGDPTGTGSGGESIYGEPFADELHQRLRFNRRGLVAMANAGTRNSNDSQFFNKHTIFGRVAGTTIYNVLALSEVELSTTEPDRPVYPPKLLRVEVVDNPFPDIVPRITREEREAQASAKKHAAERRAEPEHERKKKKKNTALLSFGEEEEVDPMPRTAKKPISSHDLLHDKKLSKEQMRRTTQPAPAPAPAPTTQSSVPMRSASPPERTPHPESSPPRTAPTSTDAQTRALQDAIRRDAHSAAPSRPMAVQHGGGRDLLASMVAEYRQKSGKSDRRKTEAQTLSKLEAFRRQIRQPETTRPARTSATPSKADDEEEMHEYGASDDDDDANWRDHRFDSGGVPLTGSNDQFSVHDYEVVDSRNTKSDMAAALGFGGQATVQEHAARAREQKLKSQGRRGRDWT